MVNRWPRPQLGDRAEKACYEFAHLEAAELSSAHTLATSNDRLGTNEMVNVILPLVPKILIARAYAVAISAEGTYASMNGLLARLEPKIGAHIANPPDAELGLESAPQERYGYADYLQRFHDEVVSLIDRRVDGFLSSGLTPEDAAKLYGALYFQRQLRLVSEAASDHRDAGLLPDQQPPELPARYQTYEGYADVVQDQERWSRTHVDLLASVLPLSRGAELRADHTELEQYLARWTRTLEESLDIEQSRNARLRTDREMAEIECQVGLASMTERFRSSDPSTFDAMLKAMESISSDVLGSRIQLLGAVKIREAIAERAGDVKPSDVIKALS